MRPIVETIFENGKFSSKIEQLETNATGGKCWSLLDRETWPAKISKIYPKSVRTETKSVCVDLRVDLPRNGCASFLKLSSKNFLI